MEYLVGAVVALIIIFLINVKRKTNHYNKITLLYFPEWKHIYDTAPAHEKRLIARAFLLQTLHLAPVLNAIPANKARLLRLATYRDNPVEIIDIWIRRGLPAVINMFGEDELSDAEARMIGVFMFVATQGFNPERNLRIFYEKFNF